MFVLQKFVTIQIQRFGMMIYALAFAYPKFAPTTISGIASSASVIANLSIVRPVFTGTRTLANVSVCFNQIVQLYTPQIKIIIIILIKTNAHANATSQCTHVMNSNLYQEVLLKAIQVTSYTIMRTASAFVSQLIANLEHSGVH